MIKKCDDSYCKSNYQDSKYGFGMRVHNYTEKGSGNQKIYRCTVCMKERE